MSSYRDDVQETAVASNTVLSTLHALIGETVRAGEAVLFGLVVLFADTAVASDEVTDRVITLVEESASASDTVLDGLLAAVLIEDDVQLSERYMERLLVLHADSAAAADAVVIDTTLAVTHEQAEAADQVLPQRYVSTLVTESAGAADATFQAASVLTTESATATDTVIQTSRAQSIVQESAAAADEVLDGRESIAPPVVEVATASAAMVTDHLHAVSLVVDVAIVEDSTVGGEAGQAWTANAESWAMSRYSPYTFEEIAVINGVAYGVAEDGVYALAGGTGDVSGSLTFGKLDLGGKDGIVHPTAAYLEYEKIGGTAELDVTTTQTGQAQSFTYQLPAETADKLTNGRFILGKGLRGRHFQLALRLNADSAYINDLRVTVTPTKRRV